MSVYHHNELEEVRKTSRLQKHTIYKIIYIFLTQRIVALTGLSLCEVIPVDSLQRHHTILSSTTHEFVMSLDHGCLCVVGDEWRWWWWRWMLWLSVVITAGSLAGRANGRMQTFDVCL